MKIALCVIAGDNCFEKNIEKMLDSVKGKVDGAFISFNGEDEDVYKQLVVQCENRFDYGQVAQVPWTDDFATARNHSFRLAQEYATKSDWITWLDCDDVVPEETDFRQVAQEAESKKAHQVYMRYDYRFDAEGQVLWHHMKERIFRADLNWTWVYPLHENCVGPDGVRSYFSQNTIAHRRAEEEPKRERNKRIIAKWYRQEPDNLRAIQLMAHQAFAEVEETQDPNLAVEVIEIYRKYIDRVNNDDDDSYIANIQVGRLYRFAGRPEVALNVFLQGIKLRPEWPTAYCEIAESYVMHGHNKLAIQWARLARKAAVRDIQSFAPIMEADFEYRPLMIEGAALMATQEFEQAQGVFNRALAVKKNDPEARSQLNQAIDMQKLWEIEREQAPDAVRQKLWGSNAENSIAFITPSHYEKWDGDVLDSGGLGGTETAVVRLAREFAEKGWRVVVFGTPKHEGVDDHGIEWWETRRWHPDEPFRAVVALRIPEVFDTPMRDVGSKILWLHDVNIGQRREGADGVDLFAVPDRIVCPSGWHVGHIEEVYDIETNSGEIVLDWIPNGVDVDRFHKPDTLIERDLGTYIYASSPDRGLERVLDYWPQICEMTRAAGREPKLKIFYGWDNIDRIIASGAAHAPMLQFFKDRVIAKIDELYAIEPNIEWIGRVNEDELSRVMSRSGFMLYPANFMETFGIVFQQSLLAGCLPITTGLGALSHLLPEELVVSGADPDSEVFERLFLERVGSLLGMSDERRHVLSKVPLSEFYPTALKWSNIVEHWSSLIEEIESEQNEVAA